MQARLVTLLVEAHRDREERIFQAGQGIPAGLWAMVLAYCGVLVGLVFFLESRDCLVARDHVGDLRRPQRNRPARLFPAAIPVRGPVPLGVDELRDDAGPGGGDLGAVSGERYGRSL